MISSKTKQIPCHQSGNKGGTEENEEQLSSTNGYDHDRVTEHNIPCRRALPYMGSVGMCSPKGYGLSAILVLNMVSILS